jgi:hypothetical protein
MLCPNGMCCEHIDILERRLSKTGPETSFFSRTSALQSTMQNHRKLRQAEFKANLFRIPSQRFQLTCQFSALTAPPLLGRPLRRRTPPAAGRPSTAHRFERLSQHAPRHGLPLRGVFQGVVSGAANSAAAGRVRWRKRTNRPSRYLQARTGYFAETDRRKCQWGEILKSLKCTKHQHPNHGRY